MKGLFGIGNTNIYAVANVFKETLPDLKLQVLWFNDDVRPRANVILIPTVKLFIKHKKALDATKAHVFIFDIPILLASVDPITLLDVKKVSNFKYKLYELTPEDIKAAVASREKVVASHKPPEIITLLLSETLPSVMKPIQTFLYTIPVAQNRAFYTSEILHFFASKKTSIDDLRTSLISVSKQKKSFSALDKILDFLSEGASKNTKSVVIKVLKARAKGKSESVEKLAQEYQVSSYDVNYILSVLSKNKKYFVPCGNGKTTEDIFKEYHSRKNTKE